MKVVKFDFYGMRSNYNLYKCNQAGDNSGEYVPLAEYQELERMIALDTTSQIELSKLRTLLKRWNEIAPDLFNDELFNTNPLMLEWTPTKSDDLTQLIQDTDEVLK